VRAATFLAALVFVSVAFHWNSQHFLPWPVRAAAFVAIAVLAVRVRWDRSASRLRRIAAAAERQPARAAWAMAAMAFAGAALIAYFVHRPYPHIPDGFAYLFQAKIFAAGRLSEPAPASPDFFRFDWVAVHAGRWFAIFPPGWPLLLAAGVKLGLPAIVNPLIGALCVPVIWKLGSSLFGTRAGLLSALFCCLSPFFLFMSGEFMSHPPALLLTSLSTLAYVSARAAPSGLGLYAGCGAAAGLAFLVRPLDALVVWTAQMAHGVWVDRSRRAVTGAIVSAVPLGCGIAAYVLYNHALVGEWFTSPLRLVSPRNRMGFGADIGYDWAFPTPGHTPWRAVLNLNHNAALMSQDLFGWPITSLLFVLLLIVFGRKDARHGLLLGIAAAFVAVYALYWYHGEALGARFYFTLLPALIVLTVEGIRQAPDILAGRLPSRLANGNLTRATAAFVTLAFVFGWLVYMPKVSFVSPYFNHKGVNEGFAEFVREEHLDNAIVFVKVSQPLHYGPAFVENDLPIGTGRVVYALDRGEAANQELIATYPGRRVVYYTHQPRPNPIRAWLDRWMTGRR
jgi:hypothetical protein